MDRADENGHLPGLLLKTPAAPSDAPKLISRRMVRSAQKTRGWMLAFLFVQGCTLVIALIAAWPPPGTASLVFLGAAVVAGLVLAIPTILLLVYADKLDTFIGRPKIASLRRALSAQARFWACIAVLGMLQTAILVLVAGGIMIASLSTRM